MSFITGVGLTAYGRHEGSSSLDLMSKAAELAISDAGLKRAATPETRAHIPYNIVLVDTAEGFRMMAHGDNDLAIGDKVTARFVPFAGRLVPHFAR